MQRQTNPTPRYQSRAKIIDQGFGVRGRITFEINSELEIFPHDAVRAQKELGYHPDGYGMFNFACTELSPGQYRATWTCSASCD